MITKTKFWKWIAIAVIGWYAMRFLSFIFPSGIYPVAPVAHRTALVTRVIALTHKFKGKSLSRDELNAILPPGGVSSEHNRYFAVVEYSNATNWAVRLVPETMAPYNHPWYVRALFLEFSTTRYPEVRVDFDKLNWIYDYSRKRDGSTPGREQNEPASPKKAEQ